MGVCVTCFFKFCFALNTLYRKNSRASESSSFFTRFFSLFERRKLSTYSVFDYVTENHKKKKKK